MDSAAAAALLGFFFGSDLRGTTTSVGNVTFISKRLGPANCEANAATFGEFAERLPQILSQWRVQSSSTHSAPQMPSETQEPQLNPRRAQLVASNLSMIVRGPADAAAPLAAGALAPGTTVTTAGDGAAGAVPFCGAHEDNVNAMSSSQHRRDKTLPPLGE